MGYLGFKSPEIPGLAKSISPQGIPSGVPSPRLKPALATRRPCSFPGAAEQAPRRRQSLSQLARSARDVPSTSMRRCLMSLFLGLGRKNHTSWCSLGISLSKNHTTWCSLGALLSLLLTTQTACTKMKYVLHDLHKWHTWPCFGCWKLSVLLLAFWNRCVALCLFIQRASVNIFHQLLLTLSTLTRCEE